VRSVFRILTWFRNLRKIRPLQLNIISARRLNDVWPEPLTVIAMVLLFFYIDLTACLRRTLSIYYIRCLVVHSHNIRISTYDHIFVDDLNNNAERQCNKIIFFNRYNAAAFDERSKYFGIAKSSTNHRV